ncbi:MAG: hypothetical protein IJH79_19485 [Lentisphaeria bacterium]|nr:hypothetical protein [Lentisphaeria bacterium]
MKNGLIPKYGRLLLMSVIAAFVILLLGADFPENDVPVDGAHLIAEELRQELAPELRGGFQSTVAADPVRLIRLCSE